jgi:hypothetical protein
MKKFKVLIFSTLVLSVLVIFMSTLIVKQLNEYKANKEEIAEVLNFENRLMDVSEYAPRILSEYLPFLGEGEDGKIGEWDILRKKADQHYTLGLKYGFGLFVIVFIYALINYFWYQSIADKDRVLGIVFVFAAFSFLYLGLQTPFIEVEAFNIDLKIELGMLDVSKTFDGRTYYLYQNKSVFQLIALLFKGGNVLVGLCLVLFSIVFPLIKLFASLYALSKPHTQIAKRSVSLINKLGKWSMADVFISSIFLAVFSFSNMNSGVDTASKTLIGIYFFLGFVLLSIISGSFFKKVVDIE